MGLSRLRQKKSKSISMPPLLKYPYKYKDDVNGIDAANPITPTEHKKLIGIVVLGVLILTLSAVTKTIWTPSSSEPRPLPTLSPLPSFYVYNNDVHNTLAPVATVQHPYRQHWPESNVPSWALKKTYFNVSSHDQICFAHVGKGGGSTIGCSLGFSLHCHQDDERDDDESSDQMIESVSSGLLAKLTSHTFHKDVYDCHDDSGYFLFIIRDPIDRVRSAFNYERPDSGTRDRRTEFYYYCPFYQVEDFVQYGLKVENITGKAMEKCRKWASKAIRGTDDSYTSPSHWYYNYQYYYEAIPSDSNILIIRNDHMEEDIRGIEDGFGCREDERLEMAKAMNKNTWSNEKDLYLSDESISILCHTLCNEIQIYKKILRRALNMPQDVIRTTLQELKAKCPEEAIAEECSDAMPDIRKKLSSKRGY